MGSISNALAQCSIIDSMIKIVGQQPNYEFYRNSKKIIEVVSTRLEWPNSKAYFRRWSWILSQFVLLIIWFSFTSYWERKHVSYVCCAITAKPNPSWNISCMIFQLFTQEWNNYKPYEQDQTLPTHWIVTFMGDEVVTSTGDLWHKY